MNARLLHEIGFSIAVVTVIAVLIAAPSLGAGSVATDRTPDGFDVPQPYDTPTISETGVAWIDDRRYDHAQAAIDAAAPGETVVLAGQFDESLVVQTDDLTLVSTEHTAVVDAGGAGRVVTVLANNVTIDGLWLRNSGFDVKSEDAGIFVGGDDVTIRDVYMTDVTFGVWVDGVDRITIEHNRIEGRPHVFPLTERGNGIHLWQTTDTTIRDNEIMSVRDGMYFSWTERVLAENNTIWESRFGVHYMYSNDNRLTENSAVGNDVGFALMVSQNIEVVNNTAVGNDGTSGHGILLKDIERSRVAGNDLVANRHGLYVYNAQDNVIADNLVLRNGVGIHTAAGSSGQRVFGNSFVDNHNQVLTTTKTIEIWNGSDRGNFWSEARTVDLTNDGISEVRHRPAGIVERLFVDHPQIAVFAESPAFEAVRLAESSFPIVDGAGVVDERPLVEAPHEWGHYRASSYGANSVPTSTEVTDIHHDHDDDPPSDDGHGDSQHTDANEKPDHTHDTGTSPHDAERDHSSVEHDGGHSR